MAAQGHRGSAWAWLGRSAVLSPTVADDTHPLAPSPSLFSNQPSPPTAASRLGEDTGGVRGGEPVMSREAAPAGPLLPAGSGGLTGLGRQGSPPTTSLRGLAVHADSVLWTERFRVK